MNIVDKMTLEDLSRSSPVGQPKKEDSSEALRLANKSRPGMDTQAAEVHSRFEHFSWLYSFCREYLFHDHTDQIAAALWSDNNPLASCNGLELGCGRCSESLLACEPIRCVHCPSFVHCGYESRKSYFGDVSSPATRRAMFFAGPKSAFRGGILLRAVWTLAWLKGLVSDRISIYREPREASILPSMDLSDLSIHSAGESSEIGTTNAINTLFAKSRVLRWLLMSLILWVSLSCLTEMGVMGICWRTY